jgi:peptidoglycan/xylan/chitin deacetylase (PgdA/CDA1 family)
MRRLLLLLLLLSPSAFPSEIAVTFDDLPAVHGGPIERQRQITNDILSALTSRKIPAVGFVNTDKLRTPQHAALLERWLEDGMELGNHTHSHPDLHRVAAEAFEADIVKGETPLRAIVEKHGGALRYFRHPFLHTGHTNAVRSRIDAFLAKRGYTTAPVTIDNSEWIFARAYEDAPAEERKRVADAYVDYMLEKVAYFDHQSNRLFDRDIRHVLLVHANALNADAFGRLADRLSARGHRFISLERALEDRAYRSPDTYRGQGGLSWIDRWALTRGVPPGFFAKEPRTPQWIQDLAGIKE